MNHKIKFKTPVSKRNKKKCKCNNPRWGTVTHSSFMKDNVYFEASHDICGGVVIKKVVEPIIDLARFTSGISSFVNIQETIKSLTKK